ncbi:MAG TPA: CopG family transcriptional regulator [Gammaproteobacteria bacterium]|nr:CopG family transcriptional regulator [Gammaproteobacteria bacterium]
MSKPLQVYLEADDLARLETFAREQGWTKSQVIRTAIRALTRQRSNDPVLDLSGDIDALPADMSREFDRHLNETFVAEPHATYRARRRKTVRR